MASPSCLGPNTISLRRHATVSDKQSFFSKMDELLTSREKLEAAGKNAGEFVHGRAGATGKILKEINL